MASAFTCSTGANGMVSYTGVVVNAFGVLVDFLRVFVAVLIALLFCVHSFSSLDNCLLIKINFICLFKNCWRWLLICASFAEISFIVWVRISQAFLSEVNCFL